MKAHTAGDPAIRPGSLVHGDGGTTFAATARWIAHQQNRNCRHAQAEPVILSTGELVACVCISCLRALPFDWIQAQRSRAEREAHCEHDNEADITAFGVVETTLHCLNCGRQRKQ